MQSCGATTIFPNPNQHIFYFASFNFNVQHHILSTAGDTLICYSSQMPIFKMGNWTKEITPTRDANLSTTLPNNPLLKIYTFVIGHSNSYNCFFSILMLPFLAMTTWCLVISLEDPILIKHSKKVPSIIGRHPIFGNIPPSH